MKNKYFLVLFCALSICIFSNCSKKNIEGTVFDNFDQPLPGVNITISGTSYQAQTDNSGKYEIEYAPGSIKLVYEKQGYISEDLSINISEKVKFPAEKKVLFKKPDEIGVFLVDKNLKSYVKLNHGNLRKENVANPHWSIFNMEDAPSHYDYFYCTGDYTPINSSNTNLDILVNYPVELNLYQIQREDGFFYQHEEFGLNSKWTAIKPNLSSSKKDNLILLSGILPNGKYCFVAANNRFKWPIDPTYIFEITTNQSSGEKDNATNSSSNTNKVSDKKSSNAEKSSNDNSANAENIPKYLIGFIGTWKSETDDLLIDISYINNSIKIRTCNKNDNKGDYCFGMYSNNKITIKGFSANRFYKFQIPTYELNGSNQLIYSDGGGDLKLKKTNISIDSKQRQYKLINPVNND